MGLGDKLKPSINSLGDKFSQTNSLGDKNSSDNFTLASRNNTTAFYHELPNGNGSAQIEPMGLKQHNVKKHSHLEKRHR